MFGDVGEAALGGAAPGEDHPSPALSQRGEGEARMIADVDGGVIASGNAAEIADPQPFRRPGRGAEKGRARRPRRLELGGGAAEGDFPYLARAATPGRVLPSSHSRNAPPAVET